MWSSPFVGGAMLIWSLKHPDFNFTCITVFGYGAYDFDGDPLLCDDTNNFNLFTKCSLAQ